MSGWMDRWDQQQEPGRGANPLVIHTYIYIWMPPPDPSRVWRHWDRGLARGLGLYIPSLHIHIPGLVSSASYVHSYMNTYLSTRTEIFFFVPNGRSLGSQPNRKKKQQKKRKTASLAPVAGPAHLYTYLGRGNGEGRALQNRAESL